MQGQGQGQGFTGTATGGDANTTVAFKSCAPFTKCITHKNDEHIDNTDNLDINAYVQFDWM